MRIFAGEVKTDERKNDIVPLRRLWRKTEHRRMHDFATSRRIGIPCCRTALEPWNKKAIKSKV